ncbi:DUF1284 domain-containing protein [Paracoccus xiamenensis]|uniref:DUF1284 domain-containing protein n=1 Tax=Paracoccus xiamenensis TaxID=2714901 RepID=UPI00140C83A7|nr:DUF1284 domain-containing protein [Paracoccus xiamenensis]NHF72659.1 DUF1284 domain-containing protein [Paracoccus xiamenensis]
MSRLPTADPQKQVKAAPNSGAVLLRPHHVLCAIGWTGRGYSPAFSANMDAVVVGRLRADPETPVEFTGTADSVCAPCPHRRGLGCASGEKIADLDRNHAQALDIQPGDKMSWAEAQARAKRLRPDDLDRICARCQWLEYGMCKDALRRLRQE